MENSSVLHHNYPQCPGCGSLIIDALLVSVNGENFICSSCKKEVQVIKEVSFSTHLVS